MQITEILSQMGGLQSMARELGISESQAQSGASAQPSAGLGAGSLLGSLFGGRGSGAESVTPGTGATRIASMLDLNGDGNPLDDFLTLAGKVMR